jgi:hypothetical protein|tara:strand:- start:260 stop:370 length:111 start_codon:yes stop_codon:yes gene_type:complete
MYVWAGREFLSNGTEDHFFHTFFREIDLTWLNNDRG